MSNRRRGNRAPPIDKNDKHHYRAKWRYRQIGRDVQHSEYKRHGGYEEEHYNDKWRYQQEDNAKKRNR